MKTKSDPCKYEMWIRSEIPKGPRGPLDNKYHSIFVVENVTFEKLGWSSTHPDFVRVWESRALHVEEGLSTRTKNS